MNRPLNPIPLRPDYGAVSSLPKGLGFIRAGIASAVAPDNPIAAQKFAAERWGEFSIPSQFTKAAITAGSTEAGAWGADLALPISEFFAAVAERSIVGKLAGLRRPPLNVRTISTTTPSTAHWAGQGAPKPVSKLTFAADTIEPLKVAALVVVTDEVLRSSNPNAELLIRNDLLNAVAREIDQAFADETSAGVSGVQPAAINYDAPSVTGTGDMADDLQLLFASFGGDLETAYFIAHPVLYASIAGANYPGVGARGGQLAGVPAIASSACSHNVLTLIDPSGVSYSEGTAEIRVSRQATIQMLDNPANNSGTATATQAVSLYQTNAVALLCEISVNWARARPGSVAVLTTSSV
jgi:hypothetical protein